MGSIGVEEFSVGIEIFAFPCEAWERAGAAPMADGPVNWPQNIAELNLLLATVNNPGVSSTVTAAGGITTRVLVAASVRVLVPERQLHRLRDDPQVHRQ